MLAEWWTYRLEDFMLFDPETYWRLFALENAALWPLPLVTLLAGLALAVALWRRWPLPGRAVALAVAVVWAWVGWNFVLQRYGPVNWAAETFAWLFFAQAALLAGLALAGRLPVRLMEAPLARTMAAIIVAVAVAAYPLLALLGGRAVETAEVIGIAPDPTVLASLGLMVLLPRNWATLALHAIPATWMGLSGLTLHAMGSWQGVLTLLLWAAAFAAWLRASGRGADRA